MKQVLIFVMCFICAHFILTGAVSLMMWEMSFFNLGEWSAISLGFYVWSLSVVGSIAGILTNAYIATAHKS